MSWKDVLVFVADAAADEPAIALGETIAERFDSHMAATFLTPLPDEPLAYEPTVVAGVWAELLGRARVQADDERKKLEARVKQSARPVELRVTEALARDLGRVAAVHARYADVAVLTRPAEGEVGELRDEIVEGVLFHAGRPALVAPPGWTREQGVGKRVMIAWDASREATRAMADAAPLIDGADIVHVVTVDAKPKVFGHGEQPGANIAAHLQRRGKTVEVRNVDGAGRSVSAALCGAARDIDADLIVMGGYASSRLRELVFGGATRDLLRIAQTPLLMAH
ncbi:MAG: universal stress protein [Hyphomonadaceae bacterium]